MVQRSGASGWTGTSAVLSFPSTFTLHTHEGAQVSTPPEDKTLCEERWKNLGEDVTKKMWGVYDETGVFVCLCRHSFVLMIADMVRSGELYVSLLWLSPLSSFCFDGLGRSTRLRWSRSSSTTILEVLALGMTSAAVFQPHCGTAHWVPRRYCEIFVALWAPSTGTRTIDCASFVFWRAIFWGWAWKILKDANAFSPSPTRWLAQSDIRAFSTEFKPFGLTSSTSTHMRRTRI